MVILLMEKHYCHSCNSETDWQCEKCEQPVCESCTVAFTQMNQIDYTLCNDCNDSYKEAYNEEKAEEEKEEKYFNSLEPDQQKNYHYTNEILRAIRKTLKNKLGN